MITIAYVNKAGDTIKLTNDKTFKEVTVMFDTPKQTDEMVLNLLERICNGEDKQLQTFVI